MDEPVLEVAGLETWFHTDAGIIRAVDGVSLSLGSGQALGIVGESGSGKTVTALTVMRLLPEVSARVHEGSVCFLGRQLLTLSRREMADLRGKDLAMVFQEPMTSLNPVFRVGEQVAEAIRRHEGTSRKDARARAVALFREVGISEPERRVDSYPHELSGGQKQRVMIAMALSCNPRLLIADEPTTALDVTIQAQILTLLERLRRDRGMALLFITHDLGVIAQVADRVAVMYRGKIVELGDVASVFERPQHPYTKGLLACRPRLDTPYKRLPTVSDFMEVDANGTLCEKPFDATRFTGPRTSVPTEASTEALVSVEGLVVHYPARRTLFGAPSSWVRAVDGIDLAIPEGRTLGLVGESGCGKSTTGRAILHLIRPTAGRVRFRGRDLGTLTPAEWMPVRRELQIVFQDPYSSLNPRMTVEAALTEPMLAHGTFTTHRERVERAARLLEEVGLLPEHLRRYPHEFSGGQRQRIAIARTLAVGPRFIVCDEAVSALDVSVQAQVLNLLRDLQDRYKLTYLFISHDLSVVKFMSDEVAVMKDGRIVERGPPEEIYQHPRQPYTAELVEAIPRYDPERVRARVRPPTGSGPAGSGKPA